jgi:hypothetical protein
MENSGRTATETSAIHTVSALETAATVVAEGDGAIAISSPPVVAKGDNDIAKGDSDIPIPSSPVERERQKGVSTEDTIGYQKKEIGKELLLLEKHLQQGCKINGVACDCCEKHPLAIEALAGETLGMTGADIYNEIMICCLNLQRRLITQHTVLLGYAEQH